MGIQGLLPLLKSIAKPVHLKDYAGQTLAVDGYVWLHKGAFACAQELCLGQPTQKYVTYFMRKIEMFKFFGIKPYVVFDGGYLPSKAATEQDRLCRREESKKLAMDLLLAAKSKEALEQFRKCVDVTPEMAFAVIQSLEAAQVDFVVAPYEADAQLAYLEKKGLVDGIVTEDSDLLVFGCKRVIFKLDQYGAGVEILQQNFGRVQDMSFHEWTMTEIRHMCILAGCDYLASIPGMGLKTAQRLLRRFKSFERAIKHFRMDNTGVKIQADYEGAFRKADLTFLYARVYDPISKSMVHLNPVPEELEELVQTVEYDFLGPVLEKDVLHGIVTGKVNPINKTPLNGPPTHQLVQRTSGHADKENRPNVGKNRHSVQPSSQSLYTYFKSTAPSPSPTPGAQAGEFVQKREPLKDAGGQFKKRAMERSPPAEITPLFDTWVVQDLSASQEQLSRTAKSSCTVVETQSRFFNVEASASSGMEISRRSHVRSCTSREDSGIGLDETFLLHVSDAVGCLSAQQDEPNPIPNTKRSLPKSKCRTEPMLERSSTTLAVSTSADEDKLDFKKAGAGAIQGWREKFSNPSGTGVGRTPGLTRATQASMLRSKHVVGSAKTTLAMPGHYLRQGDMRIVRTTPGHPMHHLGAARRSVGALGPAISEKGTSKAPSSQRGSRTLQHLPVNQAALGTLDAPRVALNLDRFKYTHAHASVSASNTSTSTATATATGPRA